VAAGVLLLGESLTANKVLGGAVILLGVYLARRR
jgi:drug/metabolite transporter (DMT)-like permease